MSEKSSAVVNWRYVAGVCALTFVLPLIFTFAEIVTAKAILFPFTLFGKWFIFFAAGIRLFIAGIKQITDPGFTLKQIFQINSSESFPIMRELGFANLCFGLIGILSLFLPAWRIVSAFGSGLYYGFAGLQHALEKPTGGNEKFALVTDIVIFIFLVFYFINVI